MQKIILLAALILITIARMLAQDNNEKKTVPLGIGDIVPDVMIKKIINYKSNTARLSDFKGKLIILDFWATWCTPCVDAFPRMDSLQKAFGDKIIVIPVSEARNSDNEMKVRAVLEKIKLPNLLSVIEDVKLGALFPHNIVPHDVWIDANGKVISITSSNEVTYENVYKAVNNYPLVIQQKRDQMDFDFAKPLLVGGNGGADSAFLYRSMLTKHIDGIGGGGRFVRQKDGTGRMGVFPNSNFLTLYYSVYTMYRHPFCFNVKRVLFESGGKQSIITQEAFRKSNFKLYCYNLVLPNPVSDSLFFRKYMLEDLNRLSPYNGSIQKALVPSLVIVRKQDHNPQSLLSSDDSIARTIRKEGFVVRIQNKPFNELLNVLSMYPDTPPIVNESGYSTEKVNMDLNLKESKDDAFNKPLDINAVKAVLNKYGLDIIDANDRPVDVLVLTKKNEGLFSSE
jgi:thiol-disulfide isomerase/thioredoxin